MSTGLRVALVAQFLSLAAAPSVQNRYDFATIPEPDHQMLFKLYLAANADVLDDDRTAVDYHYLFNVPPNSTECTSVSQKVHNDIARQELVAVARASFAKARAAAASWQKTATVRLRLDDSLSKYDVASGAFALDQMPTSSQPPLGLVLGILSSGRSPAPKIYRGPDKASCSAGHMLVRATTPTYFQLELTGGEHIATVPMDRQSAEAYLQRHADRRVALEVIAEVGPALLRATYRDSIRGIAARIVAARAVDPTTRAVIHEYPLAAGTSATEAAPAAPSRATPPPTPPSAPASPSTPSTVAPAATAPTNSGQSAMTWKGDFAVVPEPNHRSLFRLYLAANADVSDDDDTAWEYHVLFNVPPGKVPRPGATGAPSEECMALAKKAANEITRQELVRRARAEFKTTLAAAASWPKTAFFRLRFRDSLGEYDAATGSFPLYIVPGQSSATPLTISRMPGVSVQSVYSGGTEHLCQIPSGMPKGKVPAPQNFDVILSGAAQVNRVTMDKRAASAFLDAQRGALQRSIDIELIVEVGPLRPNPNDDPRYSFGTYFRVPARVVAARALDPADGRVVQDIIVSPVGSSTTMAAVPSAAGTVAASKPSSPAPKPSSPLTPQVDLTSAARSPAGPEPLTRWRVALLTLRHFPDLTDKIILDFATRLIQDEQSIWARLDSLKTSPRQNVNPKRPEFTYEWQKAIEAQPEFARGALLDLFMKPDADWSFVKREREWDERFTAAVAAFLFARDRIEGRQPAFAARELAPVAKQHLEMAVAAAPTNLWFPMKLVSWDYDFAAQAIRFRTGELLETPKGWFDDDYTVMPASAGATANHAPMATVGGPASEPQESRPGLLGEPSGTEKWRQQLQLFAGGILPNYGALALDRQLFLKSIPVDPKTGERLALKRAELHANVYITATRVELGESKIDGKPRKFAVLFATLQKMDILGPDNEIITTVKPEALPGPKVGTAGAPPPAPKPPATPPAGPDPAERAKELERERREKSDQVIAGLKKKAGDELEQSKRATACMQQVLKVHPDQDSLAFKKAFAACMEGGPSTQAAASAFGAPWRSCSEPLRSLESATVVQVEFVNVSGQPRRVYWLDFSGTRQLYGVMQPGQRAPMQTYVSHPWMVSDASDTCLGTIVISPDLKQVVIR